MYLPLVYPICAMDYHPCYCPQVDFFDFLLIYISKHTKPQNCQQKLISDGSSPFCDSILSANLHENFLG